MISLILMLATSPALADGYQFDGYPLHDYGYNHGMTGYVVYDAAGEFVSNLIGCVQAGPVITASIAHLNGHEATCSGGVDIDLYNPPGCDGVIWVTCQGSQLLIDGVAAEVGDTIAASATP